MTALLCKSSAGGHRLQIWQLHFSRCSFQQLFLSTDRSAIGDASLSNSGKCIPSLKFVELPGPALHRLGRFPQLGHFRSEILCPLEPLNSFNSLKKYHSLCCPDGLVD